MTVKKPIDFILCEGASDARFVSLYIQRQFGYEYKSTESKSYKPIVDGSFNQYLSSSKRDIFVISCAGCCNIEKILTHVVLVFIKQKMPTSHVVIIMDRDNRSDNECLNLLLTNSSTLSLSVNKWVNSEIETDYIQSDGNPELAGFQSYFAVLPSDRPGAFENLLIEFVSRKEPKIHNAVDFFFKNLNIDAKKYIDKPRKEAKALFDTMIVLMDPEVLFANLEDLFQKINLSDSLITESYSFLDFAKNTIKLE